MKIQSVSQSSLIKNNYLSLKQKRGFNEYVQTPVREKYSQTYYTDFIQSTNQITITFKGCKIHILDGGTHGRNMEYFMKSLKPASEILMHDVELNSFDKNKYTKQLRSLLFQLKKLNERTSFAPDEYIAIPCLASVPVLNIQDQYNKIMQEKKVFTPENIKANKQSILDFFKKIYDNPQLYHQYIGYMDSIRCGIEYTYPVIQEINKLASKTKNIYVPSGHPADLTLKWMADERGLKPELYHYISTGEDINNSVSNMQKEIKEKNWYSFNLLALSDANIVGLKDTDWLTDFIFAGYDSCITESARGVYNFTPIRENGKVVGYSFHDDKTNEYPYEKFPLNDKIKNLLDFIGKNKKEVLATEEDTRKLLAENSYNRSSALYSKKLYRVEDIFTSSEIDKRKIKLQGRYADSTGKTFFDENDKGEIIFKKCDCEGNGRPSVLTMWGSCFALFNAISNKIDFGNQYTEVEEDFLNAMRTAEKYKIQNLSTYSEKYYHEAAKIQKLLNPSVHSADAVKVYEELSSIYEKRRDYDKAKNCINRAFYILANQFFAHSKIKDLSQIIKHKDIYYESLRESETYDNKIYNLPSFPMNDVISDDIVSRTFSKVIKKFFQEPSNYGLYKEEQFKNGKNEFTYYNERFYNYFSKMSEYCTKLGEDYAAGICKKAANDIRMASENSECNSRAMEILKRRKDNIIFIGDLYESK